MGPHYYSKGRFQRDGRSGEEKARSLGALNFEVLGTIGIIKTAWQKGLVSDAVSKLQQLRQKGFWIDDILFNKILSDLSKNVSNEKEHQSQE